MSLTDVRLGPYQIVAPLGQGGMGEVYRAVDTRFNRPVAVKFLPEELADAAGRRRFQREAQTVSSLNHPHILTVHDVGDFEGRQYLVTEFVDGGTLGEWARAEKRTWRQIVEMLTGVADGLAAAHAAGILHRDIKPANIFVAKNGYAKLGDFGLAKLLHDEAPGPRAGDEEAATIADRNTKPGLVVGTIAFMSPEQAAGRPLDARSDIFSLGVVLYELLAGRRPFTAATDLELLQTIIHRSPEPLPAHVRPGLRFIIEKALANDPAERYQSMRELVVDLRRVARQAHEDGSSGAIQAAPPSRGGALSPAAAAFLAAAAVSALALIGWRAGLLERAAALPLDNPLANARFTRFTNFDVTERSAAISPDGRFVAFRSDRAGPFDVWLSQVGTGRFLNLTEGIDDEYAIDAPSLGFSGDGSQIWLSGGVGRRFRLMPLTGGTPRPFLVEGTVSVAWSPDGTRIAYHQQDDGDSMFVADRDGTNARQIHRQTRGLHNHFPIWSLDGRWIYFVSGAPAIHEMDVWRIAPDGGPSERLTQHNSDVFSPAPLDSRTVLYVARDQDGSGPWLWSLDVERKRSRRISLGVEKYGSVAASADGRRLVATVSNPSTGLWTVPILNDRAADESDVRPFSMPTSEASAPRVAGSSLFYLSSLGAGDGLWRFDAGQVLEIWKGSDGSVMAPAAVSPDGRRLAIVLRRDGKLRLHLLSVDGSDLKPIAEALDVRGAASWSPDGQSLVAGGSDGAGAGLFRIAADGDGTPVRLASGAALNPVWSPDGALIVYAGANVSLFVPLSGVRPDGTPVDLPPITMRRDGERMRFSPDGKALIYMQGELRSQEFWRLDLATMQSRVLTRLTRRDPMRAFDISPDGKQIVFDRLRENADIVLIDLQKP